MTARFPWLAPAIAVAPFLFYAVDSFEHSRETKARKAEVQAQGQQIALMNAQLKYLTDAFSDKYKIPAYKPVEPPKVESKPDAGIMERITDLAKGLDAKQLLDVFNTVAKTSGTIAKGAAETAHELAA